MPSYWGLLLPSAYVLYFGGGGQRQDRLIRDKEDQIRSDKIR